MKSEKLDRSMNWKRVAPFIAIFLSVLLLLLFKPLSQWISPVPQLVPDPYLTEERLDVLFNDFSADVSASAPNTWVFTHLVNGVRQLYVSQLLKLQQEIVEKREQQEDHLSGQQEQRLTELMNQYEHQLMETHGQRLSNLTEGHEQRISKLIKQHESQSTERIERQRSEWMKEHERQLVELMKQYESQSTERIERQRSEWMKEHERQLVELMKQYESQSTKRIERQLSEWMKEHERQFLEATAACCAADQGKDAPKFKPMPANTDTLHVGAALDPRRDMVGWSRQGGRTWTDRLDFQVFRFAEVDTVKITVGENSGGGPHRIYVFDTNGALPVGWQERLHFYAFKTERPNTEMISVGRARDLDPERCIFVRGNHAGKLPGWKENFVFWVPV